MKRPMLLILVLGLLTGGVSATNHPGYQERAEIRFLQGMSDHHQMALDMALDCLEKASTEAVRSVCAAVIEAQTPEIEQMRQWLLDWHNIDYQVMPMAEMAAHTAMPAAPSGGHAGHGGHSPAPTRFTDPPMMMGMFAGFNRLSGVDYDIAWLEAMIDHHDDAIHMASRLLRRGAVHPEVEALAQAIIDAQSAEVAQMEDLIAELAGQ